MGESFQNVFTKMSSYVTVFIFDYQFGLNIDKRVRHMPPKEGRVFGNGKEYSARSSGTDLRAMKNIPKQDHHEKSQLEAFLKSIFDQSVKNKAPNHLKGKEETKEKQGPKQLSMSQRSTKKQISIFDEEECMACLTSDFSQGAYTLTCGDIFCNSCFTYWSRVSSNCPSCKHPTTIIKMFLGGFQRHKQFHPKIKSLLCQLCKNSNNEEHMLACGKCRDNCVHKYCWNEFLGKGRVGQWICEKCQGKGKLQRNNKQKLFEKSGFDTEQWLQESQDDLFSDSLRRNFDKEKRKIGRNNRFHHSR